MRICSLALVLTLSLGWTSNTAMAGVLQLCAKADIRGDPTSPKAKSSIKLREECRPIKEVSLGTTEDLGQIQPLLTRVAELENQTPNVELTQQSVADAVAAIHEAELLTDAQVGTVESYLKYTQSLLSADALAAQEAWIAELETLGIEANELDTRSEEFNVPLTHPHWSLYETEAEELYYSLPDSSTSGRLPWVIPFAVLAGVVACDVKIQACAEDVNQQYGDCLNGNLCGANQTVDKQCCADKAKSDLKNCTITCGLNGPDGDYANCCQAIPATPTPATPTPATPTPATPAPSNTGGG